MKTTKLSMVNPGTVNFSLQELINKAGLSGYVATHGWSWKSGSAIVVVDSDGVTHVATLLGEDARLQKAGGLLPALRGLGVDVRGFQVAL